MFQRPGGNVPALFRDVPLCGGNIPLLGRAAPLGALVECSGTAETKEAEAKVPSEILWLGIVFFAAAVSTP